MKCRSKVNSLFGVVEENQMNYDWKSLENFGHVGDSQ